MSKDVKNEKKPDKKLIKLEEKITELTNDIQRQRADFENYRKNVDVQLATARKFGANDMIKKLLPVIDNIDRAVDHLPEELAENAWANGIATLAKDLDKILLEIGIEKLDAKPGTLFNPEHHNAVAFEDGDGEEEVISEELQKGYKVGDTVIREAIVKVKK